MLSYSLSSSSVVPSKMFYAYSRSNVSHIYNAQTRYTYIDVCEHHTFVSMVGENVQFHFHVVNRKKWKTSIQFWHIAFIILLCLWDLVEWIPTWKCDRIQQFYRFKFATPNLVWHIQNWIYIYDTILFMSWDWIVLILVTSIILLYKPKLYGNNGRYVPMMAPKRIAIAWLQAIN